MLNRHQEEMFKGFLVFLDAMSVSSASCHSLSLNHFVIGGLVF